MNIQTNKQTNKEIIPITKKNTAKFHVLIIKVMTTF